MSSFHFTNSLSWQVGDWVKVEYDGTLYPGEVVNIVGTQVNAMAKSGGYWKWPGDVSSDETEADVVWYSCDKVEGKYHLLFL